MKLEFVKCQGSGNDFVMIDAVGQRTDDIDMAALSSALCDRRGPLGADGLLLTVRDGAGFGMRMYNPDGTQAEMCGNGIRCVARQARRYTNADRFMLRSGKRNYAVARESDIATGIPTYSVRIPISLQSPDLALGVADEPFIDSPIEELDSDLRFTALSLGNPHIVARCESIDLGLLEVVARRATAAKHLFPNGVNVSFYRVASPREIVTATFERGAGLTLSCGTAMTACTTAAVLTGACEEGKSITVRNRGGMVVCRCETEPSIATELRGNASYDFAGTISDESGELKVDITRTCDTEREIYNSFAEREKSI